MLLEREICAGYTFKKCNQRRLYFLYNRPSQKRIIYTDYTFEKSNLRRFYFFQNKARQQKLGGFYISFMNLPEHLRDFIGNVHPIATTKQEYIKTYGIDECLSAFMLELMSLESDAGEKMDNIHINILEWLKDLTYTMDNEEILMISILKSKFGTTKFQNKKIVKRLRIKIEETWGSKYPHLMFVDKVAQKLVEQFSSLQGDWKGDNYIEINKKSKHPILIAMNDTGSITPSFYNILINSRCMTIGENFITAFDIYLKTMLVFSISPPDILKDFFDFFYVLIEVKDLKDCSEKLDTPVHLACDSCFNCGQQKEVSTSGRLLHHLRLLDLSTPATLNPVGQEIQLRPLIDACSPSIASTLNSSDPAHLGV
ncbi:unnamed protein product [Trichogramma brassicae]|uniref:Uncharacterized protein n=1 Tax=Trichogramma brassicae TaxID=86971 RepID=A0A6H5I2T1_9HYME|nr:unnamed protein product [Trichogramma brassicae]